MNQAHQKILKKECPILFKLLPVGDDARDFSKPFEPILFGIETGDGWFPIILELSKKLEALNKDLVAVQVKEKYGTLRFYLDQYNEEAEELIREAELKTEVTCEVCGEAGVLHTDGWYYVSCEKHVS